MQRLKRLKKEWLNDSSMKDFGVYFFNQWCAGNHTKWRIYDRLPGSASTNSPIERFNRTIKDDFLNRTSLDMVPVLDVFKSLIAYHSI